MMKLVELMGLSCLTVRATIDRFKNGIEQRVKHDVAETHWGYQYAYQPIRRGEWEIIRECGTCFRSVYRHDWQPTDDGLIF